MSNDFPMPHCLTSKHYDGCFDYLSSFFVSFVFFVVNLLACFALRKPVRGVA